MEFTGNISDLDIDAKIEEYIDSMDLDNLIDDRTDSILADKNIPDVQDMERTVEHQISDYECEMSARIDDFECGVETLRERNTDLRERVEALELIVEHARKLMGIVLHGGKVVDERFALHHPESSDAPEA